METAMLYELHLCNFMSSFMITDFHCIYIQLGLIYLCLPSGCLISWCSVTRVVYVTLLYLHILFFTKDMNFVKVFGSRNVKVEFLWWLYAVTVGDVPKQSLLRKFPCLATVTLLLANLMLSFHIVMWFFRFTFLTWSLSVGRKSICTLYVHANDRTVPWSNCVRSSAKSSAKYKNISCSV